MQEKGVLDGLRVLDLGRYQAGPRCTLMMARMGAEVIKIERIGGEDARAFPPHCERQQRLLGPVQ